MALALSRAVYRALTNATADARRGGFTHVSAAHVIAAFLADTGSVVGRACGPGPGGIIRAGLLVAAPTATPGPPSPFPIGLSPDVAAAIVAFDHGGEVLTTGHVLLRLLAHADHPAWRQLAAYGVHPPDLTGPTAALLQRGEQDATYAAPTAPSRATA